ncbi:S8 family serine peptidase [Limnothrix redekei]|uniref:S8 family serine peptidase n=1 Tax=Limnothrix redekei LRLZ20PSL1 TaxID=3112953 RepID=A0ABW7C6A9_9CYAN
MEQFTGDAFHREAARRATTNSPSGHLLIDDRTEGAKFSGKLNHEDNFNQGPFNGVKTFSITPGAKYGLILIPDGALADIATGAAQAEGSRRPLYSMATANPDQLFQAGQLVEAGSDPTRGNTYIFEDLRLDQGSDRDYNDIVVRLRGFSGSVPSIDQYIDPNKDWRKQEAGKLLLADALPYVTVEPSQPTPTQSPSPSPATGNEPSGSSSTTTPPTPAPSPTPPTTESPAPNTPVPNTPVPSTTPVISPLGTFPWTYPTIEDLAAAAITPTSKFPIIGVIDTGFARSNPDLDYSKIVWGKDYIDNDADPLLNPGEGNEHGTHILGLISALRNNGVGIDGLAPDAPIWAARAVGSGSWAKALVDYVDYIKTKGQTRGLVNLSFDLTQKNADGTISTRYEFTPEERVAIETARQAGVVLVVAAGNSGTGDMSVLAQAAQEFDNIISVAAAEQIDRSVAIADGAAKTDYSSSGKKLTISAIGGNVGDEVVSLTGTGAGLMSGTSVAAAKVTGAAALAWASNPGLNYLQVKDALTRTATDIENPGYDSLSGYGIVNPLAAISLAKLITPEPYKPEPWFAPDWWSGEGTVTALEQAVGQNLLYFSTSDGSIYKRDLTTGAQAKVFSGFSGRFFTDIAIRSDGKIIGSTFATLHEIDPVTGTEKFIGVLTPNPARPGPAISINALEFAPNGKLYGADFDTGNLYEVDQTTGDMKFLVSLGGNSSGDLVIDASGKLYATFTSRPFNTGNDRLIAYDLNTNTTQVLSSNLGYRDLYGLTLFEGKLLAYTRSGIQVEINPATGISRPTGLRIPVVGDLAGASLQTFDPPTNSPTPTPVTPTPPAVSLPPAPKSGEKGVPEDGGVFRSTHLSQNGVVVHYYNNGYLIVQPNGSGFWYGKIQLPNFAPSTFGIEPISLTDPDGDDVLLRAKSLQLGSQIGRIGGQDERDNYKFIVPSRRLVTLTLNEASNQAEMILIDPANNATDMAFTDEDGRRKITRILEPGTYFLSVEGFTANELTYRIDSSLSSIEGKFFRGYDGNAYHIKNGQRFSIPFEKVREYTGRTWERLPQVPVDDLEGIPYGGVFTPRQPAPPTNSTPSVETAIAQEAQFIKSLVGESTGPIAIAGTSPQGTTGAWQTYQNGSIHWTEKYGAVALWLGLNDVYGQNGGSSGWLGFPTRREYEWEFGKRTDFEGGFIFFNPADNSVRAYRLGEMPQPTKTNQLPQLSFPNFIMPKGASFTLGQYRNELEISDPDGDAIQIYKIQVDPTQIDMQGWSAEGQPLGTFLMPASELDNVRIYGSVVGTYPIQVSAFDGKDWSDTHTFNLTVNPAVTTTTGTSNPGTFGGGSNSGSSTWVNSGNNNPTGNNSSPTGNNATTTTTTTTTPSGFVKNTAPEVRFELDNASLWGDSQGYGSDFDAQITWNPNQQWSLFGLSSDVASVELGSVVEARAYAFSSLGTLDLGLSGKFGISLEADPASGTSTVNISTASTGQPYLSTYLGMGGGVGLKAGIKAGLTLFGQELSTELSTGFEITLDELIKKALGSVLGVPPELQNLVDVDFGLRLNTNYWQGGSTLKADDTAGVSASLSGVLPQKWQDFLDLKIGLLLKQKSEAKLQGFLFDPDENSNNDNEFTIGLGSSLTKPLSFIPQSLRVRPVLELKTEFSVAMTGSMELGVGQVIKEAFPQVSQKTIGEVMGGIPPKIVLSREIGVPIPSPGVFKPFEKTGYWKSISLG